MVDCRKGFVLKSTGDPEQLEHSLDFETDDEFYRIYWATVYENLYMDDPKARTFKNGNICIVENDTSWSIFYRYLWRRFFQNKID